MTNYATINESIRLSVTTEPSPETRSALAAFCRRNGFPHVFFEVLEPLLSEVDLVLALASTDRPWPPKGIGSQTIDAVGIAMIGSEGRGLLTPVLTDRGHSTNLGLAGAVTKQLLETLRDRKVSSAAYLVRQGDRVLERALEQAGFARGDLLTATEYAEYVEYSAPPEKVLEAFGLQNMRVGDVLALAQDGRVLDRLSAYHFTLAAAITPYLRDLMRVAPLLPGLIDVIADVPPGGVPPGSARPQDPGAEGGGEL
ncbi:MAG: hypothetical protein ACREDT_09000 [Methylocella sp.]